MEARGGKDTTISEEGAAPTSVLTVVAQITVTRGDECPGTELMSLLTTSPCPAPPQKVVPILAYN